MDKVLWPYIPMVFFILYLAIGFVVACFVTVRELLGLTRVRARKFLLAGLIYFAGFVIMYVLSLLALDTELSHINPQSVFLSLICFVPPLLLTLLAMYVGRRRLDAMRRDK